MPRYSSPLYDFKCQYKNACPYLDGLSTTWVMEEYRRAENDYQEHLQIVDNFHKDLDTANNRIRVLERENAELKAKFQALHQRQFKANKKIDEKNMGNTTAPIKEKKRGAPIGHQGWTRPKPDHIDYTVKVSAPTICPYCKSDKLEPMEANAEHLQEDIIIQPRAIVFCQISYAPKLCSKKLKSFCKKC
ncbi:MAG: hypothetical protein L6420_07720 [Elusimicrobia bacterium]|nr:hypothetical protein [Elusimicrobiota bacterium]